jgi:hypothetical protein
MVQVDVFWTYALGAGFAAAAARQLKEVSREGGSPFTTPYFVSTLLFLSILFVPSGVCLLWAFPGWETMFAGDRSLPAWLVTLFCVTNITQGILGFWVAYKLIEKDRLYWAYLQAVLGYLAMFFILVHGWDGTGWRRFFYAGSIEQWRAGLELPLYAFAYSKVAGTLYLFGLVMLPVMFYLLCSWIAQGRRLQGLGFDQAGEASTGMLVRLLARTLFLYPLAGAILASILVRLAGWVWGAALFAAVFYGVGARKGGLIHTSVSRITMEQQGTSPPLVVTHERPVSTSP